MVEVFAPDDFTFWIISFAVTSARGHMQQQLIVVQRDRQQALAAANLTHTANEAETLSSFRISGQHWHDCRCKTPQWNETWEICSAYRGLQFTLQQSKTNRQTGSTSSGSATRRNHAPSFALKCHYL